MLVKSDTFPILCHAVMRKSRQKYKRQINYLVIKTPWPSFHLYEENHKMNLSP